MKKVIVDYKKLTKEILSMLVEKYPDGYGDNDIIIFKNAKNETVEALEVRTNDTIYLVKVSTRLADSMENFEDEEIHTNDIVEEHIDIENEEDIEKKSEEEEEENSYYNDSTEDTEEDDDEFNDEEDDEDTDDDSEDDEEL